MSKNTLKNVVKLNEKCKCKYKPITQDINPIRCASCGLRFKAKRGNTESNNNESLSKLYEKRRKRRKKERKVRKNEET